MNDQPIAIRFPSVRILCEWLWTLQWEDDAINALVDELREHGEVPVWAGSFHYLAMLAGRPEPEPEYDFSCNICGLPGGH